MIVHDLRANDRDLQVWLGAVREIAAAGLDRERERIAAIFAAKACPALVGITASISSIHAPGFGAPVIVHGLPVVPESDEPCQDKVNDLLLVGVVEAAGMSVFSYRQQVAGRLVQDVRPLPGRELTNSHAGRVPLGWHTDEAAFRPQYRAEGIALLCVNNAAGATTSYRDVGDVVAALERSALATLTERRFRFPVPESFSVFGGKLIYTEPRPVLSETAGIFEVASAGTSTIVAGRDDQAANALSAFRAAVAAANGDEVKLEDGDLLVFSNVRGLHARDAVNGSRFLKRAYFRASLQALREAGHSSPMENVFSCEDFVLD